MPLFCKGNTPEQPALTGKIPGRKLLICIPCSTASPNLPDKTTSSRPRSGSRNKARQTLVNFPRNRYNEYIQKVIFTVSSTLSYLASGVLLFYLQRTGQKRAGLLRVDQVAMPGPGAALDFSALAVEQDGRPAHLILFSDVRAGKQLREILQPLKLHRIHSLHIEKSADPQLCDRRCQGNTLSPTGKSGCVRSGNLAQPSCPLKESMRCCASYDVG